MYQYASSNPVRYNTDFICDVFPALWQFSCLLLVIFVTCDIYLSSDCMLVVTEMKRYALQKTVLIGVNFPLLSDNGQSGPFDWSKDFPSSAWRL